MNDRPQLQIEYRDPTTLKKYGRNSRTHSPDQIAQVRASIREFGFTNPILLKDDGQTIGAGHARQEAAIAEKLTSVPTIVLPGLTEAQWRAYVIADNKLALNAGWDVEMLRLEIVDLKLGGFDLGLTGFAGFEIDALLAPPVADVPAPPTISLADRFMVAPFSVLNAREGWWQNRKRQWLALGIKSEVGRGGNLIGRSIFDRLAVVLGVHYQDVRAFVDERRARGMTDDEIEAEALRGAAPKAIAALKASDRRRD